MKILLIDVYNYNHGGAETVCFNTGEMLRQQGHEVIYFSLKWKRNKPSAYEKYFPESKETRTGIFRLFKNFINYFYHFEAAKKINKLILDEHPDIAHIHLIWGQITSSILPILKKHNIPIVLTAHDYRIVCPAYAFKNGKGEICERCKGKYFYKCFFYRCTKNNLIMSAVMASEQYFRNWFFNPLKFIDGFIYVSNFTKKKHELYMPALKLKPNAVLYNFSMNITQKLNEKHEKYFLFLGRLSKEKGINTLVKAMRFLPLCNLKIAGTGPEETRLKEYKSEQKIDNIEFCGYKEGSALSELIKNAYFIIVPSECYENNPMSIIEAYSTGTPVIGADIGGIPEIIPNNTGFRFESGNAEDLKDKIASANKLSDKDYTEMQINAIAFAKKNFDSSNYYQRLINFYSQFIKK